MTQSREDCGRRRTSGSIRGPARSRHEHHVEYFAAVTSSDSTVELELLDARFRRHAFPRHSHECLALGLVLAGRTRFLARGAMHEAGPGSLLLHDAESVHTGEPSGDGGWRHRMIYVPPRLLASNVVDDGGGCARSSFSAATVTDTAVAHLFQAAFMALAARDGDPFAADEALHRFLHTVLARHADPRPLAKTFTVRATSARVGRARDMIEAGCREPGRLRLAELAREVGLSPNHLITAFRRQFGLPPAAFALQCRVHHAKKLLISTTMPIAEVAGAAGFYDQSDMTRHFTRHLGLPPGAYRKQRIVQDEGTPAAQPSR